MLSGARRRARKFKVPFDLIIDDILPLPTHCPVLGIPIDYTVKGDGKPKDNSPSLDRIKPELGYIKGNIMIMSNRANMIKGCGTAEEHIKVAKWLNSLTILRSVESA